MGIEVDGPSHYLRAGSADAKRQPNEATLLQRRQLRRLGWRLVSVPYWEWEALQPEDRAAYLERLLSDASVT